MNKFLLLICYVTFSICNSQCQTIEEVLAKFEQMNGGKEAFTNVKTLQYSSVTRLNMMGMPIDVNMTNITENGKLFRKEVAGMMGMKSSYTLVTDTAGYTSTPNIPSYGDFAGMEGGIKKMEKEMFEKAKQKLVAMQEFSTLIDCKAKGSTAELLGITKLDKSNCFKIKLTQSNKQIATYYIDTATYLIKQSEITGKQIAAQLGIEGSPMMDMMGGNIDKQKMIVQYLEYADVNGIKFPKKQKLQLGAVDIEIENTDIKINETIDTKWYTAN
jgi:predicted XRE-type DNA-binding protein